MEIELTIKNYRCFTDAKPARFVLRPGFTALLGSNNSGKSTLMKMLFELRDVFSMVSTSEVLSRALGLEVQKSGGTFGRAIEHHKLSSDAFSNLNERPITITCSIRHPKRTGETSIDIQLGRYDSKSQQGELSFSRSERSKREVEDGAFQTRLKSVAEAMSILSRCYFIGPYRTAHRGGSGTINDVKIGNDLIKQWGNHKTGADKVANKIAIKLEREIQRVFRFNQFQINAASSGSELRIVVNGETYNLDELGTGLSQFITIYGNVAFAKPSFVLIDEPESNLHPSLQLDLLTGLGKFSTHGVVFSTHSIGLARSSSDFIYSVQRDSTNQSSLSEFQRTSSYSEFLGELSYTGFQELGFTKVLLVEGRTEVKAIQQLLRLYRLDHDVLLLPMGGGELINQHSEHELSEIARICEDVHALIDSERSSVDDQLSASRQAFKHNCEKVGISIHVLERRALENYFTEAAIKSVYGADGRVLKEFELPKESGMDWCKVLNWRVAAEMKKDDLRETDLGDFFDRLR